MEKFMVVLTVLLLDVAGFGVWLTHKAAVKADPNLLYFFLGLFCFIGGLASVGAIIILMEWVPQSS